MPKIGSNTVIASGTTANLSVIQNIREFENFAIQLNYGAGTGTTAKLQASLDAYPDLGIAGNWVDVANSSQTLSNAGGSFIWNVTKAEYPQLKVVVTGDAATKEIWFAGNPVPRRG